MGAQEDSEHCDAMSNSVALGGMGRQTSLREGSARSVESNIHSVLTPALDLAEVTCQSDSVLDTAVETLSHEMCDTSSDGVSEPAMDPSSSCNIGCARSGKSIARKGARGTTSVPSIVLEGSLGRKQKFTGTSSGIGTVSVMGFLAIGFAHGFVGILGGSVEGGRGGSSVGGGGALAVFDNNRLSRPRKSSLTSEHSLH